MKAVHLSRHGGLDVLDLWDVPVPVAAAGQVLVRVKVAGLNFADVCMREGDPFFPLPHIPGLEGAGIVEAVGPGVTGLQEGDRVAFVTWRLGAHADRVAVDAASVIPLPDDISFELAAAMILQGLTAHYLVCGIHKIMPSDPVLVHAAAGGMGLLLVQWLKHVGAHVIGTVSTDAKAKIARDAGADHVIVYTREDFAEETMKATGGKGARYIIDGVGRSTFLKNLKAIALFGRICVYGRASGKVENFDPLMLAPRSVSVTGGTMANYMRTPEETRGRAREVFEGVRRGWLKPRIDTKFPLERIADAHRRLESRASSGKIILQIDAG